VQLKRPVRPDSESRRDGQGLCGARNAGTLEAVIQARNMAVAAKGVAERAEAENVLTGALKSLFAVAEAYPNLKADQSFLALQEELTSTENKVAFRSSVLQRQRDDLQHAD